MRRLHIARIAAAKEECGVLEDFVKKSIDRVKLASEMSLTHYGKPLVCEYSGGKDSDVLL